MAGVAFVYDSKIIISLLQALFPKFSVLFKARSCDMYLLDSYVPLQLLKPLQVSFNSLFGSCLSKIRVKILKEEPYIGELHAVPTKFRNKLLSFHYLKKQQPKTTKENINLIKRAYILT